MGNFNYQPTFPSLKQRWVYKRRRGTSSSTINGQTLDQIPIYAFGIDSPLAKPGTPE